MVGIFVFLCSLHAAPSISFHFFPIFIFMFIYIEETDNLSPILRRTNNNFEIKF